MEKHAASSLRKQERRTDQDALSSQDVPGEEAVLCGKAVGFSRILHKDDVSSLGVRWNSAGDGGEAIRVDNGLLCSHEPRQSLL